MMPENTYVSPEVQSLIEQRLASIAAEYQVTILHACESGSRAWGFPSPDSDYDVRFIYLHPWQWYLSLEEGRDVIDLPIEEHAAGLLDLGGWDLRKTLRLLEKSNPVIWEWLQSPIVYQDAPTENLSQCRMLLDSFYSPIKACHHYLSICRNTMDQALLGREVKIKKYFYMLRPLLAAGWIERYRTIPPMELAPLLPLLDENPEVRNAVLDLQERKRHIDEQIPIARIALLDEFLMTEASRLQAVAKDLPTSNGDQAEINRLFHRFLGV